MGKNGYWCQTRWSEYFGNWDFPTQLYLGFTDNGPTRRKYPVRDRYLGEISLLVSEITGKYPACPTCYQQCVPNKVSSSGLANHLVMPIKQIPASEDNN